MSRSRFPFDKVLVTGGAGFIGSTLADRLVSKGCEVTILDNFSTGSLEKLGCLRASHGVRVLRGDVRRVQDVRDAVKGMQVVFHEAALTSVAASLKNPVLTRKVNVDGARNVIRCAAEAGADFAALASSAAVYGNPRRLPIGEEDPTAPISPYGKSKLNAEKVWFGEAARAGVNAIALRYFNVYGPGTPTNDYAGVIVKFAQRITSGRPPVIYGDGKQVRDFVYVEDVVAANLLATSQKKSSGRVFNVGTGMPTSILELATVEMEILSARGKSIRYSKPRRGEIRESYADISSIKKALGYEPRFSLREGLAGLRSWIA